MSTAARAPATDGGRGRDLADSSVIAISDGYYLNQSFFMAHSRS
jgi:hypothetical protein